MAFPLGKPILLMTAISLLGGAYYALHRDGPRKDCTLWVFADSHYRDYQEYLRPQFERETGHSLGIDLVPLRALNMRLPVLFMSTTNAAELPDALELDAGSIGRYFRPPTADIGFLPLNHYLETSGFRRIASLDAPGHKGWNARLIGDGRIYTYDGVRWIFNSGRQSPDAWIDRLLSSRLAPWSKDGVIFGVPHDVHPVTLCFRNDLFRAAGVPLVDDAGNSTVPTWRELHAKCLQFQAYWHSRGYPTRHAMELSDARSDVLDMMLLQRHVNLVDPDGTVHINDPKVAQTLVFYVSLVSGEQRIGAEAPDDGGLEYNDIAQGNLCALLTPDWKISSMRQQLPGMAGKMRMIPLPRFDPGDAPTSSFSGTMIGIPRGARNPDESWKLIEFLYLSDAGLAERQRSGILPPLHEEWSRPEYHQSDPFFGNQKVMELYASLAPRVPVVYITPVMTMALGELSYVQSTAVHYARAHGPAGLEQRCQGWLDEAAADLRRRIRQARFEPER
ncbi:MAG TPA: extracellular solute-binding protein [Tepidisphaeraceae bacterium]|nr:extracellular solute-binding protein [Tepidisphaeraceae bacterium]